MKKLLTILLMFIVLLLLAFALGTALLSSKPSAHYQFAREAQHLEMSERLNTFLHWPDGHRFAQHSRSHSHDGAARVAVLTVDPR